MRRKKEDYILIAFTVILLVIVITIAVFSLIAQPATQKPTPSPTPPQNDVQTSIMPTVSYDSNAGGRMADKIINRKQLSPADATAKETILNTILYGHNSGVVYESPEVRVEYVESGNIFMAEILSTNISKAKAEATVWFSSQGLSQEAICNLPLMFYLNIEVKNSLPENTLFSPLPEGC
jgi:hypothetical protein